jgi:hypothetical protein
MRDNRANGDIEVLAKGPISGDRADPISGYLSRPRCVPPKVDDKNVDIRFLTETPINKEVDQLTRFTYAPTPALVARATAQHLG